MSTEKFSAFAAATTLGASDEVVGLQGGVNKRFPQSVIGGGILQKTVTLTNAQIIHLPTTPVQIVAPTEINNYVGTPATIPIPLLVLLWLDTTAAAYTNVDVGLAVFAAIDQFADVQLSTADVSNGYSGSGDYSVTMLTPLQSVVGGGTIGMLLPIADGGVHDNGLYLSARNGILGDFTGGDIANTLKVIVLFAVMGLL